MGVFIRFPSPLFDGFAQACPDEPRELGDHNENDEVFEKAQRRHQGARCEEQTATQDVARVAGCGHDDFEFTRVILGSLIVGIFVGPAMEVGSAHAFIRDGAQFCGAGNSSTLERLRAPGQEEGDRKQSQNGPGQPYLRIFVCLERGCAGASAMSTPSRSVRATNANAGSQN